MVSHGDVAIGWAGGVICKFPTCSVTVAAALAVAAKYSVSPAFVSHVTLFAASETHWCISVVG